MSILIIMKYFIMYGLGTDLVVWNNLEIGKEFIKYSTVGIKYSIFFRKKVSQTDRIDERCLTCFANSFVAYYFGKRKLKLTLSDHLFGTTDFRENEKSRILWRPSSDSTTNEEPKTRNRRQKKGIKLVKGQREGPMFENQKKRWCLW